MDRRGFLKKLAGAAAAASVLTVDPERLLWVPGAKKIFDLAPPPTARQLEENVRFARGVERILPASVPPEIEVFTPEDLQQYVRNGPLYHEREPYMPGRYTVDLGTGERLVFDSNWKMQDAYDRNTHRRLTVKEATEAATQPFIAFDVGVHRRRKE